MNNVYVYGLWSGELIKSKEKEIAEALIGTYSRNPYNRFFIHPLSGSITYSDYKEIFREDAPRLPSNESFAKNKALRWLQDVNPKVHKVFRNTNEKPNFIPTSRGRLKHLGTRAIASRTFDGVGHWLSQFAVEVDIGLEHKKVPVMNSLIEVRIGDKGKIIGFCSRWRPFKDGGVLRTRLPFERYQVDVDDTTHESSEAPPNIELTEKLSKLTIPEVSWLSNANEAHHLQNHSHSTSSPEIVYVLHGESEPQRFLSPYYFSGDNHHATLAPASQYSLVANITEEAISTGLRLHATAMNSTDTRNFSIRWLNWQLDLGTHSEPGYTLIGDSDRIELGPGVHNVSVSIEDLRHGSQKGPIITLQRTYFVPGVPQVILQV